ncbi:hypothetical protein M422DRAFT_55115 [Sphaerobolus stellatus SS14]|uniref:Unplaced genomic scaffold SPHSTscaffold_263, whole genome shotgun sequence n=1 Tax=Sphaerobolus stellatus (strain SS14) TaxID=990650 RepID=A0A0C9UPH6_SPHS4|nr:hypothetical protein M422DRAFT_55115 [Sphaerobolus stellatus SS14]
MSNPETSPNQLEAPEKKELNDPFSQLQYGFIITKLTTDGNFPKATDTAYRAKSMELAMEHKGIDAESWAAYLKQPHASKTTSEGWHYQLGPVVVDSQGKSKYTLKVSNITEADLYAHIATSSTAVLPPPKRKATVWLMEIGTRHQEWVELEEFRTRMENVTESLPLEIPTSEVQKGVGSMEHWWMIRVLREERLTKLLPPPHLKRRHDTESLLEITGLLEKKYQVEEGEGLRGHAFKEPTVVQVPTRDPETYILLWSCGYRIIPRCWTGGQCPVC